MDLKAEHPLSVTVTLVNEAIAPAVTASIASGPSGAITRDASPNEVILALKVALTQTAILPLCCLHTTRGRQTTTADSQEVKWLRSLAHSAPNASVRGIGRVLGT